MKQTELDQIQLPLNMAEEIICAVPRANRLRRGREILGQMTAISNVVLSKRISYPENSTRHSLTHSLKVPDRGSRFSVIFPSKVAFLSSLWTKLAGILAGQGGPRSRTRPEWHGRRCDNNIITPPGKFYNCLNPQNIQNARNMVSDSP